MLCGPRLWLCRRRVEKLEGKLKMYLCRLCSSIGKVVDPK